MEGENTNVKNAEVIFGGYELKWGLGALSYSLEVRKQDRLVDFWWVEQFDKQILL